MDFSFSPDSWDKIFLFTTGVCCAQLFFPPLSLLAHCQAPILYQQLFSELILCTTNWYGCWEKNSEKQNPCPHGACVLMATYSSALRDSLHLQPQSLKCLNDNLKYLPWILTQRRHFLGLVSTFCLHFQCSNILSSPIIHTGEVHMLLKKNLFNVDKYRSDTHLFYNPCSLYCQKVLSIKCWSINKAKVGVDIVQSGWSRYKLSNQLISVFSEFVCLENFIVKVSRNWKTKVVLPEDFRV